MLRLRNVTVRAGSAVLLDAVSLEVGPGEMVALLGPNGAGKSTLLRVAAGETTPDAGTVALDDRPLAAWAPEALARRRAVLPQRSLLDFGFTAYEVVLLGRTPHARRTTRAEDAAAARRALEEAGAGTLAARRYPTLSGGEAQRVHLARTLAQLDAPPADGARYLLLDEPTAALDLAHQHAVLGIARRRAAEGAGVLVVLHDLNLAARYADRLIVLCRGRLCAEGPPAEVLTPALLRSVFEVAALILPHPCHACPLVVTLPEEPSSDGAVPSHPHPTLHGPPHTHR